MKNNDTEWVEVAFDIGRLSPGFSERFHQLLDYCNFPKGKRRAKEAIRFFGKTRSVIYRCLSDNHCPKDISDMVKKITNSGKVPIFLSQKEIALWLVTGEKNPFEIDYIASKDQGEKHAKLIEKVTLMISKEASAVGLDLTNLSNHDILKIYQVVIEDMIQRKSSTPSSRLIKNFIKVISHNWEEKR